MSDGPGYRNAPTSSQAPEKKGFLDSVLGYRPPGDAPFPKIRTAFTRGLVAVGSTPWLLIGPFAVVIVIWLIVVAVGFPGPFGVFGGLLALPPVSTTIDVGLPTVLLPTKLALIGGLVSVLPRGIFLALTSGMIVDVLDGKRVSVGSLRRGIRALPTAVGLCIVSIGFWIFTLLAAQTLGPGLGTLVQIGVPALGVYLFGCAVTIAISERRGMADSLAKSVRAARLPGSNNLFLALLYVFGSFAIQVVLATSYGRFDVNPTIQAWVAVLVANLFHVSILATLAFRYLYIADSVPDSAPRRPRGGPPPKAGSQRPGTKNPQGKATTSKKPPPKGKANSNKNRRR